MKKHKFNWVDGLVLLLAVLLVAGAVYKFWGNNVTGSAVSMQPVTYSVTISGARQGIVDALQVGDTIFDGDSGNAVGNISAVQAQDARVLIKQDDGTVAWGTEEARYDVVITVDAQATVSGDNCQVNRIYQLNVGSSRSLYTKYATWTGKISDIQIP